MPLYRERFFRLFTKTEFVTFKTVEQVTEEDFIFLPKEEQCARCFQTTEGGHVTIEFGEGAKMKAPELLTLIGLAWDQPEDNLNIPEILQGTDTPTCTNG